MRELICLQLQKHGKNIHLNRAYEIVAEAVAEYELWAGYEQDYDEELDSQNVNAMGKTYRAK